MCFSETVNWCWAATEYNFRVSDIKGLDCDELDSQTAVMGLLSVDIIMRFPAHECPHVTQAA